MDRRTYLRAGWTCAALGLAGCLGDGDGGPDEDYGTWLDDARGDATPVDRTGEDRVTVAVGADDGFSFDPAAVEVSPGTTVVWEWTGRGGDHNVAHEGGGFRSEFAGSEGHTFERAFEAVGVFKYYCDPHRSMGMKGAVRVVE